MSNINNEYETLDNLKTLAYNIKNNNPFYNVGKFFNIGSNKINCENNLIISRKNDFLNSFITNLKIEKKTYKIPTASKPNKEFQEKYYVDTDKDNKNEIDKNLFQIGLDININKDTGIFKITKEFLHNTSANKDKRKVFLDALKLRNTICSNITKYYEDYYALINDFILLYNNIIPNRLERIFYQRCRPRSLLSDTYHLAYYDNTKKSTLGINFEKNIFPGLSNKLKILLSSNTDNKIKLSDLNTPYTTQNQAYYIIRDILVRPFDIKDSNNCWGINQYSVGPMITAIANEKWITGYTNLTDNEIVPDIVSDVDFENKLFIKNPLPSVTKTNTNINDNDKINLKNIFDNKYQKKLNNNTNNALNQLIKEDLDVEDNSKLVFKELNKIVSNFTDESKSPECAKIISSGKNLLNKNISWINIIKFFIKKYNSLIKELDKILSKILDMTKKPYIEKYISNIDNIRYELVSNIILLNLENVDKIKINGTTNINLIDINSDNKTLKNLSLEDLNKVITLNKDNNLGIIYLELLFSHFINNTEFSVKSTQNLLLDKYMDVCVQNPKLLIKYKLDKFQEYITDYFTYINTGIKDTWCSTTKFISTIEKKLITKKNNLIKFILDENFLDIFMLITNNNFNNDIEYSNTKEQYTVFANKMLSNIQENYFRIKNVSDGERNSIIDDSLLNDITDNANEVNRFTSINQEYYEGYLSKNIKDAYKNDNDINNFNTQIANIINNLITKYCDKTKNFNELYNGEFILKTSNVCRKFIRFDSDLTYYESKNIQNLYIKPILKLLNNLIIYAIVSPKVNKKELQDQIKLIGDISIINDPKPPSVPGFSATEKNIHSNAITLSWNNYDPSLKRISKIKDYTIIITDENNSPIQDTNGNNISNIIVPANSDNYTYLKWNENNENEYTIYNLSPSTTYKIDIFATTINNTKSDLLKTALKITTKEDKVENNIDAIIDKPKFNDGNITTKFLDYNKLLVSFPKAKLTRVPFKNYIITFKLNGNNSSKIGTNNNIDIYINNENNINDINNTEYIINDLVNLTDEIQIDIIIKDILEKSSDIITSNNFKIFENYNPTEPSLLNIIDDNGNNYNTTDTIYFKLEKPIMDNDNLLNKFIKKYIIYITKEDDSNATDKDNNQIEPIIISNDDVDKIEFKEDNINEYKLKFNNLNENNKYKIKAKSCLNDGGTICGSESELELTTVVQPPQQGGHRKYVLKRSSKSNSNRISISPKSLKKISKKSPKQYRKVFDQYYGSK